MSDLAHFTAFRSRVAAHAMLADKTYTSVRLNGDQLVRANYVIVYPATPSALDDGRFTARQAVDSDADYEYDVRVVTVNADGLLTFADAVKSQLIGHVLDVDGRSCTAIRLDTPGEKARFDKEADLHYLDMTFMFRSFRTA